MILAGVYLLEQFDWMFYVFGVLLLYSAYKMVGKGEEVHPSEKPHHSVRKTVGAGD